MLSTRCRYMPRNPSCDHLHQTHTPDDWTQQVKNTDDVSSSRLVNVLHSPLRTSTPSYDQQLLTFDYFTANKSVFVQSAGYFIHLRLLCTHGNWNKFHSYDGFKSKNETSLNWPYWGGHGLKVSNKKLKTCDYKEKRTSNIWSINPMKRRQWKHSFIFSLDHAILLLQTLLWSAKRENRPE